MPRILPAEQLLAANGVEGVVRPVLQRAAGPAVAGVLVGATFPTLGAGAVAAYEGLKLLVGVGQEYNDQLKQEALLYAELEAGAKRARGAATPWDGKWSQPLGLAAMGAAEDKAQQEAERRAQDAARLAEQQAQKAQQATEQLVSITNTALASQMNAYDKIVDVQNRELERIAELERVSGAHMEADLARMAVTNKAIQEQVALRDAASRAFVDNVNREAAAEAAKQAAAAQGLGAAQAALLAREGATVLLADINADGAAETVEAITAAGGTALPSTVDVRDASQVEAMVSVAVDNWGGLDILYNNAGVSPGDDDTPLNTSEETWQFTFDVNVKGLFLCNKYGIQAMLDSGGGSIVNVASFVAHMGAATPQIAYTSSKGAVLSMTRELGPVLAGLMVAARVASSIAAEIGTMRVTEQIDALTTLSVNPFKYLVVPRVLAGTITLPLLVLVGDIIGVYGGYIVSTHVLGFGTESYLHQTWNVLERMDVISGLTKAAAFGFVVTLMGCYHGYNSGRGAQGVGASTTNAVVTASILILILNYLLTQVFFS